ncbi:MAG: hypothetical protein U0575_16110 [Phycisphaerales bacterium]
MANAPHPGDGARPQRAEHSGAMTPALLGELARLATSIEEQPPAAAGPLWGAVHRTLLKGKVDPAIGAQLVVNRDVRGLVRLVATLRGEAPPVPAPAADDHAPVPSSAAAIDPETLKHAMRAFRKRLKLLRLDQESSLGVGPMSGGRKSDIDAIVPPREFPMAVWAALADDGKLRRAGPGLFELVEE